MTVQNCSLPTKESNFDASDPQGSISIISISDYSVTHLDFTAYDGLEEELRNRGIRIFDGKNASEDFEPKYISVSPDDTLAFVTLQENNAVAVIDLTTNSILDIQALGTIDHSNGEPSLVEYELTDPQHCLKVQTLI